MDSTDQCPSGPPPNQSTSQTIRRLVKEQVNRAWDLADDEIPTNQATNLPTVQIDLPITDQKLTGEANWFQWSNHVKRILVSNSLETLIDDTGNILRPMPIPDNGIVKRWRSWSQIVAFWLLEGVSNQLNAKTQMSHPKLRYADEVRSFLKTNCAMTATWSNDASDDGNDVSRGVVKMWSRIDHSLMAVDSDL